MCDAAENNKDMPYKMMIFEQSPHIKQCSDSIKKTAEYEKNQRKITDVCQKVIPYEDNKPAHYNI